MLRKILYICLFLSALSGYAQKEAANWYFGFQAGLNFEGCSPNVLTDGQMGQLEGCATMSDSEGNLLLYTNAIEIYNSNHQVMQNGTGLLGSSSSSQSAIVIPKPGDENLYYVFAVDSNVGANGLTYSTVDMSLDNGLGGVLPNEKNIQLETPVAEKLTAVFHGNGKDIWVISHRMGNNEFIAYLINESGVNPDPIVSAVGEVHIGVGLGNGAIGYLKASPNGNKLACAQTYFNSGLEVFDFNKTTGEIENPMLIDSNSSYGVEFSPNSKVLYANTNFSGPIYQYDLTQLDAASIQNSKLLIASSSYSSGMQLAIDGRLYIAQTEVVGLGFTTSDYLSVIKQPNNLGTACDYVQDLIYLNGKESTLGLPPFITSYFQYELKYESFCFGQETLLSIDTMSEITSIDWDFGDPDSNENTSIELEPSHVFSAPGIYQVTAEFYTGASTCEPIILTDIVTILPSPIATEAVDLQTCDTLPNDGLGSFSLSTQSAMILGSQSSTDYAVAYYASEDDARAEDSPLSLNYTNTSNPQTIYARVTNTTTGCYDLTSFTLTVNPVPEVTDPDDQQACEDSPGTGIAQFDLTQSIPQITGGNTALSVKFYKTQANVINNIPITSPANYTNATPGGETVYFQAADPAAPDCKAGGSLDLVVNDQPLLNTTIPAYKQCDYNNPGDGFEAFDLTTMYNSITSTQGLTLTYEYQSAGTRVVIADPTNFTNTVAGQQTIYVWTINASGCKREVSFQIEVNPLPLLNLNTDPFYACEEVQGEGKFELTKITQWLTSESANYLVSYYLTEPQAEAGDTNTLADPHITGPTTIYARLENTASGCVIITPVLLDVLAAPIAATPAPLEECDFNNDGFARFNLDPVIQDIKNALGNVEVTIHETIEDATHNVHVIPNTGAYDNNEQYAQTLYIRVQSSQTACYDLVELKLIVHPVPEAVTPTPYGLCDNGTSDTDGTATFDLSTKIAEVLGTIDPLLFGVTFHETNPDAVAGTPQITNPLSYTSTSKTIYVRVTNNATGCYDIVALELIVYPLPVAVQPTQAITLCDVTAPANDQKEVFDLTTAIPGIIGTQQGLVVTFHHSEADAIANTGAILTPESYQNTKVSVETLFVRVTTEATGCYRIVLLDIKVEPIPVILEPTTEELTVCDTNGEGVGEFDLAALIEKMKNGEPNLEITFHLSAEDALSGANAIPNPENYKNTHPLQVIYVRVENTLTGCVNSTPYALTLIVEPAPQAPELDDIRICDQDDNGQDGKTKFDLTIRDQDIYDALGLTDTDITISYFKDEASANAGAPRITNPKTYTGTHGERIWVRVESIVNQCYSLSSFELYLDEPLLLTLPSVYALCDEALPNDGFTEFDLTTKDNEILGPLGIGQGFTVAYYETNPKTDPTAQPIANPKTYTNPTQGVKTLFVVVTSEEGCTSYTTLTIKVLPLPVPNPAPKPLVVCDNTAPVGEEVFDLTLAEDNIRNNDQTSVITYYTNKEDAETATDPIPDPTAYSSATGSVWVRMEMNTNNPADPKCYQVVELKLQVDPLPAIGDENGNVPPYVICAQNSTGFENFDLNSHIEEILGDNAATDYDIEFYLDQAALDAGTALPRMYTNVTQGSQTILVVVTNKVTGCTITKPLQLLAEEGAIANPVVIAEFDECDYEGANDGVITWDLTVVEAEVLQGQDPAIYEVTYHISEENAKSGENAIATPEAYENTPDGQTIWIRVTNTATVSGCSDITTIEIKVERLVEPVINTEGGNNTICVEFGTDIVERALELRSGITPNGHTFHWFRDGQALTDADPSSGVYLAQQEGSYTVQVTGPIPNECESEESAVFEVIKSGQAKAKGKGYFVTNAFSDNQTITVLVEGYGEYEYSLDNGPRQSSNVFTNVAPGPHDVHVWDVKTGEFSCDELVISGVSIIDYPNFFTPNGDGFHDTWNIIGLAQQTDAKIYIFDRYGKLIKQIAANGEGWDGTFNGSPVPSTDYWFTVTYKEYPTTKEFKAHFSLKR